MEAVLRDSTFWIEVWATDLGVPLPVSPTAPRVIEEAKAVLFPDEPPDLVPEDVWVEILRDLRGAAAVLEARGEIGRAHV